MLLSGGTRPGPSDGLGGPGVAPQNPQGLLSQGPAGIDRTAMAGGRPQTGRPLPCWTHTAPGEPLASESLRPLHPLTGLPGPRPRVQGAPVPTPSR